MENEPRDQSVDGTAKNEGKKVHQTHFSVLPIQLTDDEYDSGYEWVSMGNGKWKRVPKIVISS